MDRKKKLDTSDKDIIFTSSDFRSELPVWYEDLFKSISHLISSSRKSVILAANRNMIMLYYHIGQTIISRQRDEGWGTKVIDRLSYDIKQQFPGIKGFSPRNLKYMRKLAETYPNEEIVQRSVAQLSWRHNISLMEKCDTMQRRLSYALAAIKNGWSFNMLDFHLKAFTLERSGMSPTNFDTLLPNEESEMMHQIFKDPYLLDFLGSDEIVREKELEKGLSTHITQFLLELGQGFAFVGKQVHVEIGGDDFYIDMLFYHLQLRCYIVVELKATKFEPSMMGQLNMYQNIIDQTVKHPDDKPTIGLLLVKSKNETVVKYSLSGSSQLTGVASWENDSGKLQSIDIESSLPSIKEIEAELNLLNEGCKE